MDGRVHVYRRPNSRYWQCSTYLNGRNHRVSTKEEMLPLAKEIAREWYMAVYVDAKRDTRSARVSTLYEKFGHQPVAPDAHSAPTISKKASGPLFREAAEKFIHEYPRPREEPFAGKISRRLGRFARLRSVHG